MENEEFILKLKVIKHNITSLYCMYDGINPKSSKPFLLNRLNDILNQLGSIVTKFEELGIE